MAHSTPSLRWVLLLTLGSAGAGASMIGLRGRDLVAASAPGSVLVPQDPSPRNQGVPAEFDLYGEQDSYWQERREIGDRFVERDLQDSARQSLALRALELNERLLIRLPSVQDVEKYIIRRGDSLIGIAGRFKQL